jgi:zinc transport system substrate-binding protein
MVENIQAYLTTLMPEHSEYFEANATALISELEALDQEFRDLMTNVERTTIYHGGRFAMHYLMNEYGIGFVAAPMETDPGDNVALVARMITEIQAYDIPVIFHEELVNPYTANMIASETGAQALVLHTIHNVSTDEIAAGMTYVDLQRHNIEVLRIALN